MIGISSARQLRGGAFDTSRYTDPYAVRNSSFVKPDDEADSVTDRDMIEDMDSPEPPGMMIGKHNLDRFSEAGRGKTRTNMYAWVSGW